MKMTASEYDRLNKQVSPNSSVVKNCVFAFLIGGLICTIGEFITNSFLHMGMLQREASALTSISLIFLAALLTGLNVYDNIAKFGGAGTLVPITGFSNSIVAPALEFKSEGFVLGLGAKMFIIAGPVLVYGITSSVVYGVIAFLFKLY